ncbi:OmpH family outer membrane protein [Capnocytophaga canimorsus]|uniref:Chaperone protein skp n=1 Tax=Capnocytophaga canimorsus TaxID=28188 RepID=A0A0B7IGN7_9FLAO|nr:OmpH family outer membrane protein [Capnocytophaga canimorsus]GJQ04950.1 membrane protein [Capnocytophaga canimorsus]CEN49152.1 Chaperone protein skp [Capnocytophaga canimorsus]
MMRNIKTIMIAFALVFGATSMATAQSKVAHIDMQKLLQEMPEMKAAEAQLKKLEQTYTADIQASIKELQTKAQTYQNEAAALSEQQLKAREAEFLKKSEEIQSMENNIRQAQQTAQQDLQKKQEELVEPILNKIKNAVDKVAKSQGVNYVFNSSLGSGLIVANGIDLYSSVKKELGF